MTKKTLTIGGIVHKSGLNIRTLRYYDSIDLLKPSDYTEGGHRLYSEDDLRQLEQIKALKFLGFSLKEIKEMIQKSQLDGTVLLKSLEYQKQLFTAKQQEINEILSDLDWLIETVQGKETMSIDIFCSTLHRLMFDEDAKIWFKKHFSEALADDILNMDKSDELRLDKEWADILSEIKNLANTNVLPSSEEAQNTIKQLFNIVDQTLKGNMDKFSKEVKELPSTEPFHFPNPLTELEQQFLQEAIHIYRTNNKEYP